LHVDATIGVDNDWPLHDSLQVVSTRVKHAASAVSTLSTAAVAVEQALQDLLDFMVARVLELADLG